MKIKLAFRYVLPLAAPSDRHHVVRELPEKARIRIERTPVQPAYFGCLQERSPEAQ